MTLDLSNITNRSLSEGGLLSRRLIERGCNDFHSACRWIKGLPYGSNLSYGIDSLFVDGRGTCTTKHGVAAELAAELGLPVFKFIVYYQLNESIIEGAAEILKGSNVPFIPGRHCVLGHNTHFTDLTWGNQTGKKADLVDFDLFVRVSGFPLKETSELIDNWALSWYQTMEPALLPLTATQAQEIRSACFKAQIKCAC